MSVLKPNHSRSTLQPLLPLLPFAHFPQSPISLASDMSDEPGVQFMGGRTKRNHRPMSEEPSDEGQRAWHRHFHPPHPDSSRPDPLPPMRPPRHGFDFRRPAPTTPREDDVIDLTNEPETPLRRNQSRGSDTRASNTSRPPRFGRNILTDVVDLEDESANDPGEGPSSSPEVQFVRSTVRSRPSQRLSARMREIFDAWTSQDLPTGFPPLPSAYTQVLGRLTRPSENARPLHDRGYRGAATDPEDVLFLASDGLHDEVLLDYARPSFVMEPPSPPGSRLQRDTYRPPSPAPEGFTRTLGEDDVAICPNCSWELGTGEGRRQEIWVAKPCGHVYCGECAENRSLSKAKKAQGSQKTKPFYKCQVADCGKQVSAPTAMVHLFL